MQEYAYGGLGFLNPRESSFSTPKREISAARIEGLKKASYLTQMDQVYAQISSQEKMQRKQLAWDKEKTMLGLSSSRAESAETGAFLQNYFGEEEGGGKKNGFNLSERAAPESDLDDYLASYFSDTRHRDPVTGKSRSWTSR